MKDPFAVAPKTRCSFCGKSLTEIVHLVKGERASICDGCVDLCAQILRNAREEENVK